MPDPTQAQRDQDGQSRLGNGLEETTKNDILETEGQYPNKSEGAGKIWNWVEKVPAHISLRITAKRQYPWLFAANVLSPVTSSLVENRIGASIARVDYNQSLINNAATTFGVPKEIIGGIIFKEQLTQSLPDIAANIDTFFDGTIAGKIIPGSFHSTGLGAIFPSTARAAWEFIDPSMVNSLSDKDLQYTLSYNNEFNIQTIAAVLVYEAMRAKLINDPSEAKNLTQEQWKKAVAKYNGSDEYARKVYEYLNDIKKFLD
jgi:hypothetical protein